MSKRKWLFSNGTQAAVWQEKWCGTCKHGDKWGGPDEANCCEIEEKVIIGAEEDAVPAELVDKPGMYDCYECKKHEPS